MLFEEGPARCDRPTARGPPEPATRAEAGSATVAGRYDLRAVDFLRAVLFLLVDFLRAVGFLRAVVFFALEDFLLPELEVFLLPELDLCDLEEDDLPLDDRDDVDLRAEPAPLPRLFDPELDPSAPVADLIRRFEAVKTTDPAPSRALDAR